MTDNKIDSEESIPKWDVALEALTREEYKNSGNPLRLDDFLKLAKEHAIRFDDIMVTMFELVLNDKWRYCDNDGNEVSITRKEVNDLYVNGRLNEKDVQDYQGLWSPKPE